LAVKRGVRGEGVEMEEGKGVGGDGEDSCSTRAINRTDQLRNRKRTKDTAGE